MKIISYNVNGIRAAIKKGLVDWIKASQVDVLCIQETKAHKEQVDLTEIEALGYHTYWQSATTKKGYSGVAIFSKIEPKNIVYGYGDYDWHDTKWEDDEGRIIRADYDDFSVMSVYMPSGTREERIVFKMEWNLAFQKYIGELQKIHPNLVICGDYNIAHEPIDIHNPKSNAKRSGFLPEERAWLTEFMKLGFTDTFRHLNKEPHNYTWWNVRSGARAKNLGWRIDYQMISESLNEKLQRAVILSDAMHSDHCPILIDIE